MKKFSPRDIYDYLNERVEGQDEAKKTVSNALFLHYVRFFQRHELETDVPKSNLLLLGPSGNGKTHLMREACKAIPAITGYDLAPMIEIDCTSLTARGWEGDDLSDLLEQHIKDLGSNQAGIESTVVFLDEIDKLCLPGTGKGGTDHNRNTQYNLLKAVEGMEIQMPRRGKTIDTTNMLFVFAGNFAQIRAIRELEKKPSIGFNDVSQTGKKKALDIATELEKGGMATQLVGRISYIAELDKLSKKELMNILKRFILPERKATWDYMGYKLEISNYYLKKIVDQAYDKGTGARGLAAALDAHLEAELFDLTFKL